MKKYFGPVYPGTDIAEITSWSNLIHMDPPEGTDNPYSLGRACKYKIQDAARYGAKSLLSVFKVFFTITKDSQGNIIDIPLRSNYVYRWNYFLRGLGSSVSDVWGILVLDEPFLTGLRIGRGVGETKDFLNSLFYFIRSRCPAVKIVLAMNMVKSDFLKSHHHDVTIPPEAYSEYGLPNCDVAAPFYYYTTHKDQLWRFKSTWRSRFGEIQNALLPGQELAIIPGTFCHSGESCSQSILMNLADFYYDISKSNNKVVALVPFLYEQIGHMVGMKHLPNVLAKWKNIGREITGGKVMRKPVYRFRSWYIGDRFYTISESEKNSLMSSSHWIYEGIAWYAYDEA